MAALQIYSDSDNPPASSDSDSLKTFKRPALKDDTKSRGLQGAGMKSDSGLIYRDPQSNSSSSTKQRLLQGSSTPRFPASGAGVKFPASSGTKPGGLRGTGTKLPDSSGQKSHPLHFSSATSFGQRSGSDRSSSQDPEVLQRKAERTRKLKEREAKIEEMIDKNPEAFSEIPEVGESPDVDEECREWIFPAAKAAQEIDMIAENMFKPTKLRGMRDRTNQIMMELEEEVFVPEPVIEPLD